MEFPVLSRGNYHEWALVMKVNLEALNLWSAVESDTVEHREDRMALATIPRAVPAEMKSTIADKKSAKEAWAAVKMMCMGDERVQEANAQRLLKEFENIRFKEGERVDDFAMRLNSLATELREHGEKLEEVRVVKKLLRVVPPKLDQAATSIEMLLDLNTMSLESLVGRLRVAEEKQDDVEAAAAAGDGLGQLLLTEEQWQAHRRQRAGKNRAEHDDIDDDDRSVSSSGSGHGGRRGKCFNCGVRGHFSRDCRKPRKEKAMFADVDEEPALL